MRREFVVLMGVIVVVLGVLQGASALRHASTLHGHTLAVRDAHRVVLPAPAKGVSEVDGRSCSDGDDTTLTTVRCYVLPPISSGAVLTLLRGGLAAAGLHPSTSSCEGTSPAPSGVRAPRLCDVSANDHGWHVRLTFEADFAFTVNNKAEQVSAKITGWTGVLVVSPYA